MDDAKEKVLDDIQHLKGVDELRKVEAFIQELKTKESIPETPPSDKIDADSKERA